MGWKENFKNGFDYTYKLVRKEYSDIHCPCYGGRFYWFLISRHFESLYLYLTQKSLIFTASGAYITEIPFNQIRRVSVKQGTLVKSSVHIRIVADKKYHLIIKKIDYLSTGLTGDNSDNVKKFIELLQANVNNNE